MLETLKNPTPLCSWGCILFKWLMPYTPSQMHILKHTQQSYPTFIFHPGQVASLQRRRCFSVYENIHFMYVRNTCEAKTWISRPHFQNYWFSRFRTGSMNSISDKFSGDTEAIVLQTNFESHRSKNSRGEAYDFSNHCRPHLGIKNQSGFRSSP